MNYKDATNQQLFTIAYHEPCHNVYKLQALAELDWRKKRTPRNQSQAHIKRKRG